MRRGHGGRRREAPPPPFHLAEPGALPTLAPLMKSTFRALVLMVAAGLAAAASLISCNRGGDGGIKVGEFASLTGKEATFGISSHEGTQLATEVINAAGGVLGKKIELLVEDTQSKAGEPATVVNKLIARDNVVAILGEVASSRSLEAAPICQQNKIPMISPASTNPKVTESGDYIFRVCFIDPFQGTVMANFATKTLKAEKVAVLTDAKSDYSKGLARYFKEQFAKNGGQIVPELDYNGGDKDFKAQLTSIKGAGPQAVFVPGYYTDVALICIQAKELGLNVPLFGGDGWESEKLGLGGSADYAMHLAKEAIARPVGTRNEDPLVAQLEDELYDLLNETGIGPMGLGGDVTVLQCHIEHADTHMTLNPVAVNYQCWAARRASAHIAADGHVDFDREL